MPLIFAVDPLPSGFAQEVVSSWDALHADQPEAQLFALIDAAFDDAVYRQFLQTHPRALSIYAGTDYEELMEASPHLVKLTVEHTHELEREIDMLVHNCSGVPMLSFVSSPLGLADVKALFQRFITVHTADGTSYALRFADTCVLIPLLDVLSPAQRAALTPPGTHLLCPTRSGQLIASQAVQETPAPMQRLDFSDEQVARLEEAMEADAVLAQLGEDSPRGAVQGWLPSEVHAFVQAQIQRAHAHGISHTPDLLAYCATALDYGAQFDEHPDVVFAVRQAGDTGHLAARIASVPSAAWIQVKQRAAAAGA